MIDRHLLSWTGLSSQQDVSSLQLLCGSRLRAAVSSGLVASAVDVSQPIEWFAMNARQGDFVVGLAVLSLVTYLFVATADMPTGPAGFPRLIAVGLLICGSILLIRAYRNKLASEPLFSGIYWPTIFLVGGLWLVLIALATQTGFLIPGTVFLAIIAWSLTGRPRTPGRLAQILGFALGTSAALWLIFNRLLGVESPGALFF